MDEYPNLFAGIEKEVKAGVYAYYYPQVMQGVDVSPYLTDPQAWIVTAQNIRLRNGDYDRLKPTRSTRPVSPQTGDSPRSTKAGRVGKRPVALDVNDEEIKTIMKLYNLSRDDAEDIIRQEQEMAAQGIRR